MYHRNAFTLIELLVVIAIIAILSVVVILTLNPAQLLMQSRDANRFSDMASLNDVLGIYLTNSTTGSLGTASTTYISISDPLATSTAGDQCQGLSLPPLPTGDSYHCAASSTNRSVTGNGWLPVNFSSLSSGSPLGSLPIDPVNTTSSGYYYTYTPAPNGTQHELTTIFESQKYIPTMANDGGSYDGIYQIGSDLNITPPFRSYGLVGYWPLDEGSGTIAYDFTGNGNNGTLTNGPTWTSGIVASNALSFSGSSYVTVGNASVLNPGTQVSIAAWVNFGTQAQSWAGIVSKADASNAHGYDLRVGGAHGTTSTLSGDPNAIINNGTWTFLVGTYNGQTVSLYVNGVLTATSQYGAGIANNGTSLNIGADGTATFSMVGSVDDTRIYNRALSAVEIKALYSAE